MIEELSNRDEIDDTMPSLKTFQRIAEKFHKLWKGSDMTVMMELCLVNKIFICIVCMCDECMC
jgi:hypothetical protein